MKGDNSKFTFSANKRFRQVRMQQGRVQTDADWNEQLDINEHLRRTETRDIIGRCCVPMEGGGFQIETTPNAEDLSISAGRIYVDGILCELTSTPLSFAFVDQQSERIELPHLSVDGHDLEVDQWIELFDSEDPGNSAGFRIVAIQENILSLHQLIPPTIRNAIAPRLRRAITYTTQPDYPNALENDQSHEFGQYLIYLDVWQRHLSALEDPSIREVALGGPDTTTRSKTIFQVKLFPIADQESPNCSDEFPEWLEHISESTGQLAARARPSEDDDDPCILPPQAGFRRLENQLYRVEIHRGSESPQGPTFKWSRENGSLTFRIEEFIGAQPTNRIRVAHLGLDDVLGLEVGQWVELSDDNHELLGNPGSVVRIASIDSSTNEITLSESVSGFETAAHAKVRRWDMTDGEMDVIVPAENEGFIELEDGVEVRFDLGRLRTGDYWCIPARTATADIEWPRDSLGTPLPRLPDGVEHSYCKLAIASNHEGWQLLEDCRRFFPSLCGLETDRSSTDPGFHITRVQLRNENNVPEIPLANDMFVTAEQLARGIEVFCDDRVERDSVRGNQPWIPNQPESILGKPVCTVTLDLPYPLNPDRDIFSEPDDLIGFRPLKLFARVDAQGERIIWEPFGASRDWLANPLQDATTIERLFLFMRSRGSIFREPRILAHLNLRGNFIWAESTDAQGQLRYLNGDSFGHPGENHTDVRLPSGNSQRGGDFEMWFWLVPESRPDVQILPRMQSLAFAQSSAIGGEDFEATVSLTLPAGDSAADVTLESSRPSVLVVPPTVAINSGQISEQFTIRTNELPDRGPSAVAVTVTASFGGRAVQQTIRVIRG